MKLQKQTIESVRKSAPSDRRVEFAIDDHPGLRLRIYPTGQVTWMYRYRAPGDNALRVIALGQYPDLDPAAAAGRWREQRALRAAASDPHVAKAAKAADAALKAAALRGEEATRKFTVSRLIKGYLDDISETKRSWKESQRILNKYVKPKLGDLPVAAVGTKQVREVLKPIAATTRQQELVAATCRAMWNWSTDTVGNPWVGAVKIKARPRDRVLSVAELKALMKRLATNPGIERDMVALIVYTGTRREEAVGARRQEFDLDDGIWRIPAERKKTGRPHEVLLSAPALELVERVLSSHKSEWLFPSARTKSHLAVETPYKQIRAWGAGYTLHDIRRTFATWLGSEVGEDGIPVYPDTVIDRVLAHAKSGVVRHYNVARLKEPAKRAWAAWAAHLGKQTKPNVVEIKRG